MCLGVQGVSLGFSCCISSCVFLRAVFRAFERERAEEAARGRKKRRAAGTPSLGAATRRTLGTRVEREKNKGAPLSASSAHPNPPVTPPPRCPALSKHRRPFQSTDQRERAREIHRDLLFLSTPRLVPLFSPRAPSGPSCAPSGPLSPEIGAAGAYILPLVVRLSRPARPPGRSSATQRERGCSSKARGRESSHRLFSSRAFPPFLSLPSRPFSAPPAPQPRHHAPRGL